MYLLCQNVVEDFDHWLGFVHADAERLEAAGMRLERLWRDVDAPNTAYFLFHVEDRSRAEDFMAAPESVQAGEQSGVIDGWYHFMESAL